MRTRHRHTLSTLLAALTFVACDRPAENALAPAPSLNGATVERFQTIAFTLIFDAERQLLAAHMPSNICDDGEFNVVDLLRVITPSAIGQRFAQQSADEQVAIYRAGSPAEAGLAGPISFFGFGNLVDVGQFCAFMGGPSLIAEGTVQRISTFSLASFHGRWVGRLTGVDGRDYQLSEAYQLNAAIDDPNNPETFTEPVVQVLLTPLP